MFCRPVWCSSAMEACEERGVNTVSVYLRVAVMAVVLVVGVPIGLMWRWGAENCESSCDRWSYSDVAVFGATWGPWIILLLLACEAAYAQHRTSDSHR